MNNRLLGFFSGFPNRRFPSDVGMRLSEELKERSSLVFISAWPDDYKRNDTDSAGMHCMFDEYDIPFKRHYVIDNRMEASHAGQLIREASCLFLMGGYPRLQMELIREKGLDTIICNATSTVLGVSAGAINMAKHSLDTKESPVPYEGLSLADITIKPHFELNNQQVLSTLLQISMELPIYATEDDSAIFVVGNQISSMGKIHLIHQGEILPFK